MNRNNRDKIELIFSNLAGMLFRHRIKCLLATLSFILVLTSFIPKIVIDTSAVALLRKTDAIRIRYDDFRNQFDVNDIIIIAVTPPDIFDTQFLEKLKAFHEELESQVPYIKQITSLINARDTYGDGDQLIVGELIEAWPKSSADLESLRERIFDNQLYKDFLISSDGTVTTLIIETEAIISQALKGDEVLFEGFSENDESADESNLGNGKGSQPHYFSEKENRQVVEAINRVSKTYHRPDFSLSIAGGPVVLNVYNRAMEKDIVVVIILSLLVIALLLSLLFRNIPGVLIPEMIIIAALLSTAGLISIFNISIKLTTVVLPGFLLAVSVGYAVHILAIFFVQYHGGKSKEDAIAYAVGHSGLAIVLTALTTAASLLSFAFAELTAIADLGLFGAAGVILAMIYTFLMLPPCIALIPFKRKTIDSKESQSVVMDRILLSFAALSDKHPRKVVAASLALFAVSVFYTSQVSYSHNVLNWISKEEKIKGDVPYIDKHLQGSIMLEVILDTNIDDGVKEPALLKGIETITRDLMAYSNDHLFVGKVFSVNDVIKEIHRSLHNNDARYYKLPDDKRTISQELLLFENSGSDDLTRVADGNFRKARVSIKIPSTDAVHLVKFISYVQDCFQARFPDLASITITGIPTLLAKSIPASLHSMAKSYVIAFCVIALLMIFHVGSIKIGLLSMISNLLPIFMTMGLMGAMRIKIDMSTIMIGSIAIGIVVDDTLHFMYNFRKYYEDTGDAAKAIQKTLLGTGRAILLTSMILCSGFFILMTASLSLLVVFGFLTGITIIFALLADFIVNPALMVLVTKGDVNRRKNTIDNGMHNG